MITVFIRTLLIYILLIVSMRLMGKRQIGELQVSELIVAFMLSELAALPIADKNISILYAVVPILLLLSVEVILSYIMVLFPSLKVALAGKPSMIIYKGKLDQRELRRQRLSVSELLCALRQSGISDISECEYVILEENGKLSVFPKASKGGVTPEILKVDAEETGIGHYMIIDRKIIKRNIKSAGWSPLRLSRELEKRELDLDDIFLFSVNDAGEIQITMKEKKGK